MMMINQNHHHHPTVEVPSPPWEPPSYEDQLIFSPQTNDYISALKHYLPSSELDDSDTESSSCDLPFDSFTCDNFRMYDFKVRKCARGRSHDWTECPYAHPGEKARRRDPRKYHYSGTPCPEFRRGSCRKGDSCEFSHGVFECWLHPARYRTQPCKDGAHCKRRVCFFAHSSDQIRILPESHPTRLGPDSFESLRVMPPLPESPPMKVRYSGFSPTSVFDSFPDSPPLSPSSDSVSELASAMRSLQVGKVGPRNVWGVQRHVGSCSSPRSLSPRGGYYGLCRNNNIGGSLPTTPTRSEVTLSGLGMFDISEEEVPMERVESGKELRAKIYAKLSKENSLDRERVESVSCVPDFEWVSELVK